MQYYYSLYSLIFHYLYTLCFFKYFIPIQLSYIVVKTMYWINIMLVPLWSFCLEERLMNTLSTKIHQFAIKQWQQF